MFGINELYEAALEELAESRIGHLSDGMWATTDNQKFYSRRMAVTAQIEIERNLLINRVSGGSDE
jgi:hypothetical protein